jgi:sporulation protein YlmC with PRC-barrel domain
MKNKKTMVLRLSEMSGLDVFTEDGRYIGELSDISINPETGKVTGLILTKLKEDFAKRTGAEGKKGVVIPYEAVKSIGDIVLMRDVAYQPLSKE